MVYEVERRRKQQQASARTRGSSQSLIACLLLFLRSLYLTQHTAHAPVDHRNPYHGDSDDEEAGYLAHADGVPALHGLLEALALLQLVLFHQAPHLASLHVLLQRARDGVGVEGVFGECDADTRRLEGLGLGDVSMMSSEISMMLSDIMPKPQFSNACPAPARGMLAPALGQLNCKQPYSQYV